MTKEDKEFKNDCKRMLYKDLKNAGFEVQLSNPFGIRVFLQNRIITKQEVIQALDSAGYDSCQYEIETFFFHVFVNPIVL